MNRIFTSILLFCIITVMTNRGLMAQRGVTSTDTSLIAGIHLPAETRADKRLLSVAAAKTLLEMEASKNNITVGDVEVFSFPIASESNENTKILDDGLLQQLEKAGYTYHDAEGNPSYKWLVSNQKKVLMYLSSTRKQTDLYFGDVSGTPVYPVAQTVAQTGSKTIIAEQAGNQVSVHATAGLDNTSGHSLIGTWGNIEGSKVNFVDGSTNTVISGVSRGMGLNLNNDGSYLQYTVVTSGYPYYRIFVSTTGKWTVDGNLLVFTPDDRHYRRWNNEIKSTDEHSVPEPYTMIWILKRNEVTGKDCLYVKYTADQPDWEELCRD